MDPTLVEKLARLRGVGDAYHDYRGDLRYFSLKTKTDLLRAMGCRVDDPTALAADLREAEIARFRRLLPSIASARGTHAGVDLNISARHFGARLRRQPRLDGQSGGRQPLRRRDLDGGVP